MVEIEITGKKEGKLICDEEDVALYKKLKWHIDKDGYLLSSQGQFFHRLVMDAPKGMEVDHINHGKLDNRKQNLRLLTSSENRQNKPKRKGASSSFHGVMKTDNKERYRVVCNHDNVTTCLGTYDDEKQAAVVYDMFLIKNDYIYKPLNFPNRREEYKGMVGDFKFPDKRKKSTDYIGVSNRGNGNWIATIKVNKIHTNIHTSTNALECAKAFDKYVVENKIRNKELNFPDDHPTYKQECCVKTFCKVIDDQRVQLLYDNPDHIGYMDKEDYEIMKYYPCHIDKQGYNVFYVDGKGVKASRFLLNITDPDQIVDHEDGMRSNDCRSNWRITTIENNNKNKSKQTGTSSQFLGVTKHKETLWRAQMGVYMKDGKILRPVTHIGQFRDETDAARARDLYIMFIIKDEYYKLNFKWNAEEIEQHKHLISKHL